jgi:hypothetical protein
MSNFNEITHSLLKRNNLPVRLALRLRDMDSFIQSDKSGFTCFQMFLVKKSAIISVHFCSFDTVQASSNSLQSSINLTTDDRFVSHSTDFVH